MPNTPAAAARVSDNVKHSEAQKYRFWGAVGTIGAVVAGVAIVAGLAALEVISLGTATPLVVAGGVLVAGGMTAVLSGQVADVAADAGRKVMGPDEGPIVTGISSILIGPEKHAAAHLGSWASCKRHKHGGASTMQYAKDIAEDVVGGLVKDVVSLDTAGLFGGGQFNPVADWNQGTKDADQEHNDLEQILQGSSSVFFGRGRYHAARIGDKGTCGFIVGHGCETVIIGGETVTEGEIGTGDDPDKHITDLMKEWGGKAALAGIVLITLPLGIAAVADVAVDVYLFSQAQGFIDDRIKDPEMRHKVDLAITVLTLGYGAAKGHGGAPEDSSAAGDREAAGSGGGAGEPVGESGRGPADGGATEPAATSAAEQPTRAGRSENSPSEGAPPAENPVHQIGEQPGGSDGSAPPDQGGGSGAGERTADTPSAAQPADPLVPQGDNPGGLRAADGSGGRPDLSPEENFPGQQSGNNCAPQSCQQIIRQATGRSYTEAEMEAMGQRAGTYDPARGTTVGGEADILNEGGVPAHAEAPTPDNIQKALDNGQGVITGHSAGRLWEGDPNYTADPNYPMDDVGHAVHTTGLVRDANGNVTHYVINDTGTGTSGRMVPADQFHQSLDGYDAVMTDAPIRTPTAARDAAPAPDAAPTAPEGTTVPRDAASRGDPASERGNPASEEGDPAAGDKTSAEAKPAEDAQPADTPEAKASGEGGRAAGDGDPTVQTKDSPGGYTDETVSSEGTSEDDPPPSTKLSQAGGLKATEGTRIVKPDGSLGPASHPLENHGPDKPLRVVDEPVDIDGNSLEKSVEQRMIDNPKMLNSTKFTDRATMETAIGKTIDAKDADIKAWLSTSPPAGRNMPAIEYDPQMGNLGDGYSRPAQNAPYASSGPLPKVTVVLKSTGTGGYIIQTAFPGK